MTNDHLSELLKQLHQELALTDQLDPDQVDQLRDAVSEIEDAIAREEVDEEATPPIVQRLRDAAEEFEQSHPALTNTIGRVADALSQLGI